MNGIGLRSSYAALPQVAAPRLYAVDLHPWQILGSSEVSRKESIPEEDV
jgi:hypothetical protein